MNNNESPLPKASSEEAMDEKELLKQILEYSRKTHNYLKWQIYITIILVVLPLFALAFVLPSVLKGLSAAYGGAFQ